MRVSRGMLITVLLLAPGARGQVVPATGGDELASRLLGSLEALDVPADVWVVLSPESAERLIAESTTPDADWQAAVARAGCDVTGVPPLRTIGEKWTFPVRLHGEGDKARALSEILVGVPESLRARLCAGAWIPSAPLADRARQALSALHWGDESTPSPDAPDTVISLAAYLDYTAASGASPDEERRELVGLTLSAASPDPFAALSPESPLGLTLCYAWSFPLMSRAPVEYPYITRALSPGVAWGPDCSLAALELPAAAVTSRTGRLALRLGDWADVVGAYAGEPETAVDESYRSCLVVAPDLSCTGRQVGAAVSRALDLEARNVGALRFVGESDASRAPEQGAELAWDGYEELVDWAVDLVQRNFRIITASDLPEGDLAVLFGSELGPLSPPTAARLHVLGTGGTWRMLEATPPVTGGETAALAGRGVLWVGIGVARVRVYGGSPTAEAHFARLRREVGLAPSTALYAVDGGMKLRGPALVVDPSRFGLGNRAEGDGANAR